MSAAGAAEKMMLGLIRAAELLESRDGGRIWDTDCAGALAAARALNWGKGQVGQTRPWLDSEARAAHDAATRAGEQYARESFDMMIGRLDRILSEFMRAADAENLIDDADHQTLKHHADDLIGVGNAVLKKLSEK